MDGKVDIDEFDKQQKAEEKLDQVKVDIKAREKEEHVLKGRPGKGHQKGYKSFCRFCFTEYLVEMPKCTHCGK